MKERLDILLVKRGYCPSREKAKAAIKGGAVLADGRKRDKASDMVDTEAEIAITENLCPYVSRGGLKLERSLREFGISLSGKVCMDIGASAGGFTDCMLQNGAAKVYAVDVGFGQLDPKLRADDRVVNMERQNIRYLDAALMAEPIDFIGIDVSFISLKLVLPVAAKIISDKGEIVCLIKPQFEAGRRKAGKKGIIRDHKIHEEVIEKIMSCALDNRLYAKGLTFSPIRGEKGNIEFLLHLSKTKYMGYNDICAHEVVVKAHETL